MPVPDLARWTEVRLVLRTQELHGADGVCDLFSFPIQATNPLLLANTFCKTRGEIES